MSKMQYQTRMNNVIQYIENNLDNAFDIKTLLNISCYSEYHFHRLFRSYVGESIYAYRKRLLLERAVKQLQHSGASITEIAFNAGYHNQASFNKAFKHQYACSPSDFRKKRGVIQPYSLSFNHVENVAMKTIIKQLEPIHVTCAREIGRYQDAAPKAWGRIMKYGYSNKLMQPTVRSIGITHDDPAVTAAEQIRYDACLDIQTTQPLTEGLFSYVIAGGRYAMFLHKGAYEGLQASYNYIFNQWLPDSGYELNNGAPCFENYLNRDPRKTKPENLKTEIYIPIEKK